MVLLVLAVGESILREEGELADDLLPAALSDDCPSRIRQPIASTRRGDLRDSP